MQWNRASRCEYDGKSMESETITWSEFPSGGKAIVEKILVSEKINKSKRLTRKLSFSFFYKKKIIFLIKYRSLPKTKKTVKVSVLSPKNSNCKPSLKSAE